MKRKILAFVLLFLGSVGGTVGILGLVFWLGENSRTEDQAAQAIALSGMTETDENSELIEQKEDPHANDPYWLFIKMNLLDVDLNALLKTNNETKGWIQVAGTNVNYPFVQHADNDFYLKHSFNQSYNSAGWVFLDYRNSASLSDRNSIFYAHGRVDTTMFGGLRQILYNGWLSDRSHFMVRTSTPDENGIWEIFSAYHLPTTTDYLKTSFRSNTEYAEFLDMIISRSAYNFNAQPSVNDRIITLSTCYNDKERMVVHAKLIKYN